MKKSFRSLLSLILFLFMLLFSGVQVYARISIPQNIKIGLYFGGSSVDSFSVSAKKGLLFGEYKNGNFKVLYDGDSQRIFTIRKDSYYSLNNGTYIEYTPVSTIPDGKKYGPYHVQIGGSYDTLDSVVSNLLLYRQKGIDAFPVFQGTWEIWAGSYLNPSKAQDGVAITKNKLGDEIYKIIPPSSSRIVVSGNNGRILLMYGDSNGTFQIKPHQNNSPYIVNLNGINYRGCLEVRRFEKSDMTVINVVPLEKYLYSVVAVEMGYGSFGEALKAQAVAARTYAVSSMGNYEDFEFDICNTTNSQAYMGYDYEKPSSVSAVDETRDKILTYKGSCAKTFYFCTSGGKTENIKNVWGGTIPYLISVDDTYEPVDAKYRNWEVTLSADRIRECIGNDIGDILKIAVTRRSKAGRVIELVVEGTNGKHTYSNERCRTIFGLRSQLYEISSNSEKQFYVADANFVKQSCQINNRYIMTSNGVKQMKNLNRFTFVGSNGQKRVVTLTPTEYTFTGHGWGHAVGMSQEGAKGMSEAGFSYDKILTHYFTGTKVE